MKKLHWKISLVLLTIFLLIPYAGEFSILKVKADETGQTEISSSSSATSDAQSSEVKNFEQKQAPTEPTPPPSFTGTLSDMIDQVYPSIAAAPKPSPKSFVSDDGVTINGQFYSNAEFDALLDKMTLAPNAPDFTVDTNGQIHFDYDLRIFPLAAPIFVAALPIIGKVFVTGATIIVGGLMINENNKEWNKVTSRLNAAQRAKVEAEKAKAKAKAKPKTPTKAQPQYKDKIKVKGKQKDDIPERFRGEKPLKGELGKDAAERVLKKFKEWNPKNTKGQSLFSQLKKYFDTHFK
ncbi:hypothetical protein LSG16_02235 [Lactococcus cremoris]|uniref:hypothetical protein n=1 Tax=Lactococcus lactis subsp. cremoris TaxID=1359 RepID=UPI001E285133|nr:hypothetical protein [Lactococcus cremoris]MCD6631654.1 hypothetical protein [Lactococcus cremoris]